MRRTNAGIGHVVAAIIINALVISGAFVGAHFVAPKIYDGTVSVGFQGTPEKGVSHIYLTVREIDFQGGVNTTDSAYLNSPVTFDLLSLVNVTRMLGDVPVSPGHYNMIRFDISSAVATISGKNVTLHVPGPGNDGDVKVPVQFDVVRGQTTSIVLTISADDTLIIHNHILRPVITGAVAGPY
jgi:hypothetical protein